MKTLRVPLQIDARGGLAVAEDTRSIVEQQITDILVTAHYERIMDPSYGAGVPEFVFTPIRTALLQTRAGEIRAHLSSIVALADIVSVRITESQGQNATLALDVRYTVRPSTQVFSVRQTVSGIVTDETTFGATL